jgi:DNA-binding transcriptional regulator PaaX
MANRDSINQALKVIGSAGFSGLSVSAPSASRGLVLLLRKHGAKHISTNRLLYDLKRRGLVEVAAQPGRIRYTLTPAGAYRLQELGIDEIRIPPPKKWDKKWRLVAFDVPVKQSRQRQEFVEKLQSLGFVMLQKSLWVHPFPCFTEVEEITSHYNVLRHCSLMEVDIVDEASRRHLRRQFKNLLEK